MKVTAVQVFIVLQLTARGAAEDAGNTPESDSADSRRTLAPYTESVLRGFGGVFRKESLKPFLVGLAATGLSRTMDELSADHPVRR